MEAWLLGGLLSLGVESVALAESFFMDWDCGKRLVLKGFARCQQ